MPSLEVTALVRCEGENACVCVCRRHGPGSLCLLPLEMSLSQSRHSLALPSGEFPFSVTLPLRPPVPGPRPQVGCKRFF